MPQMAPLSWTILYMLFLIIFSLMIIMNFYNKSNFMKKQDKYIVNKMLYWKW